LSAVLTVCCLGWTGVNLWQEHQASADVVRLNTEASQFDLRYTTSMAEMPPRVTSTANMRAAIAVERMLATQSATPYGMSTIISRALDASPDVRLLQMDWKVDLPANTLPQPGQEDTQAAPISSLVAGIPQRAPQLVKLEAEVLAEQDDYRKVVDSMNRFARALAQHPHMTVEIDKPPVDTRSSVKLAGKAGAQAAAPERARFTLSLGWRP
jgi:hypothetical protein